MGVSKEWDREKAEKTWRKAQMALWSVFIGGLLGGAVVLHFLVVTPASFNTKIDNLLELQNEIAYVNPVEDKSKLLQGDVPLRKIIFEFPQGAGTYSPENIAAINATISEQVDTNRQLKNSSYRAEVVILCILFIQLGIFCIAAHYTILTGKLLPLEFQKEKLATMKLRDVHFENIASHVSKHSTSILLTIGIGGTFLGLLLGLNSSVDGGTVGFNVVALLHGLKISFTSTLAGVFLSLLVRIVQQAFDGRSETMETLVEKIDELKENIEGAVYKKVTEATAAHYDGQFGAIKQCSIDLAKSMQGLRDTSKFMADYKQEMKEISAKLSAIAENSKTYSESVEKVHKTITTTQDPLSEINDIIGRLNQQMEKSAKIQGRQNTHLKDSLDLIQNAPQQDFENLSKSIQNLESMVGQLLTIIQKEL